MCDDNDTNKSTVLPVLNTSIYNYTQYKTLNNCDNLFIYSIYYIIYQYFTVDFPFHKVYYKAEQQVMLSLTLAMFYLLDCIKGLHRSDTLHQLVCIYTQMKLPTDTFSQIAVNITQCVASTGALIRKHMTELLILIFYINKLPYFSYSYNINSCK